MEATRTSTGIRVGGDARQRLHDARGYGLARDNGEVELTAVETAHLLYRGDLSGIDGTGFSGFLQTLTDERFALRFAVYKDLRDRGFYLDPVDRVPDAVPPSTADFAVYERGAGRAADAIAFYIRVLGEASTVPVGEFRPGVLAVVDDEGEVGYIEVAEPTLDGSAALPTSGSVEASIVGDRVHLPDPPDSLYAKHFFGRPVGGREATEGPLAISLLEAAYLSRLGVIDLAEAPIRQRGRRLEGDGFDRRARVYAALRDRGVVPKTGYKFGADYRVYSSFESITEMGHSDHLVRVLEPGTTVRPNALSLDVRLAHGVGKRMVFAITTGTDDTALTWLSVTRLTP